MAHILNRAATKKIILMRFKELRAGPPMTRVSRQYLDDLEAYVSLKIIRDVKSHPSIGVTFKP